MYVHSFVHLFIRSFVRSFVRLFVSVASVDGAARGCLVCAVVSLM